MLNDTQIARAFLSWLEAGDATEDERVFSECAAEMAHKISGGYDTQEDWSLAVGFYAGAKWAESQLEPKD